MTISKKLTIVFTFFYLVIIIYLLLFFFVPDVQNAIMQSRQDIARFTEGANYFWALLISVGICFVGSASIGFPVPFPFVLFSFSNSINMRYASQGLMVEQMLINGSFWLEILGIAIAGGLGCALGELTSYLVGRGAKKIAEKSESPTLENVQGFGRLVLENPNKMYTYIFIAAALPIPDDPLWIALGMAEKKINFPKCLIWGWAGKNITTLVYVLLPILILLGFKGIGLEINDVSSIITEALMLIATLTIMYFILAFDWNKYIDDRTQKFAKVTEETNKKSKKV